MASGRGPEPVGEGTRDLTADRRADTTAVADTTAPGKAAETPGNGAVAGDPVVPDNPASDNPCAPATPADPAGGGDAAVPVPVPVPVPVVGDPAVADPGSHNGVEGSESHEGAEPDLRPTAEHPVLFEPLLPPSDIGPVGAGAALIALPAIRSDGAAVAGDGDRPAPPHPAAPATARAAGPAKTTVPTRKPLAAAPPGPGPVTSGADEPTLAVKLPRARRERQGGNRLIPRTALGLAALILAASVGAAFSGAVLYSYYQYRLSQTTDKINAVSAGYQKAFANAQADLNAQRDAARAEIAKDLAPLRQLQTNGDTLPALVKKVAPSMYFVHTLDQNGQPSVGSAFVVASNTTRSLLLTSYTTVAAATHRPGPDLFVRHGNDDTRATVWTWDNRYDLALIVVPKAGLPPLTPAPSAPPLAVGDAVFAVSGLGGLGASAVPGVVTDVSAQGIEHTAPVGQAYQGGPLVNSAGQVVAVASRSYSPLNFASDGVWFAPYELSACALVLSCPSGTLSAQPGAQRTS